MRQPTTRAELDWADGEGRLTHADAAFAQARRRRRAVRLLRAGMDVAAPPLDPDDPESSALQAVHEALRRSRPHPAGKRLLPIAQESQLLQELLRAGSCRLPGARGRRA